MALYKRKNIYWISFNHNGKRIQKTTGTSDQVRAQRVHDELKASLWRVDFLNEKLEYTWMDAAMRWLDESQHKRSLDKDQTNLRWLDPYLRHCKLKDITRDQIEAIAKAKEKEGAKAGTVNRILALIRAILNKAMREWEWIDKVIAVRLRKEAHHRIRWLTHEQAAQLIAVLPNHLAELVRFSLATGLRQQNVLQLKWQDVDLERQHAWIHCDEAKAKKAIAIPLNEMAMEVLKRQLGRHAENVFTYQNRPIKQCGKRAWQNALKKVGIKNFRWHDLRHTWASWHVQNGTSLHELQQLGGWATYSMVLRYAHLSSGQLKQAANRILVTNLLHSEILSPGQNA